MKLPQSKIRFKEVFFYSRFILCFLITCFSLSFHLFIVRSQIPSIKSEVPAPANLAARASTPKTDDQKFEGEKKAALTENKSALTIEKLVHGGDTLDVDFLGSLEYDWRGKADDDGFLSALPHLNTPIFTLCRTEDEIGAEISAAYSKMIRNPQVVVRVLDRSARQPAILFGAVSVPQRYRIERPIKLNELIVMSGGITDKASGEISIFRPAHVSCVGHNQTQIESQFINFKLADLLSGKTEANPQIKSGDVITVEEAAPLYVTGGVVAPQLILFRGGMTLSRVIASAGGLARNADQTKIAIFRRRKDNSGLEIIEVNLEKIGNRTADDIQLQAYDIIEVSQSGEIRSRRPPVATTLGSATQFDINKLPIRLVN